MSNQTMIMEDGTVKPLLPRYIGRVKCPACKNWYVNLQGHYDSKHTDLKMPVATTKITVLPAVSKPATKFTGPKLTTIIIDDYVDMRTAEEKQMDDTYANRWHSTMDRRSDADWKILEALKDGSYRSKF